MHQVRRNIPWLSQFSQTLDALIAGDMTPRQSPRQESSSVRLEKRGLARSPQCQDSSYRANSIAFVHDTDRPAEVNLRALQLSKAGILKLAISGRRALCRLSIRWDIAPEQCGGRSEEKKNDCGRAHIGTPGSPVCGRTKRMFPFHARLRSFAGPCFRTVRSGRSPRSGPAQPRHKSAAHRFGSATGAVERHPGGNLLHSSVVNGGGCHYDRLGKANPDHPWTT
jgi:hypothetical protein